MTEFPAMKHTTINILTDGQKTRTPLVWIGIGPKALQALIHPAAGLQTSPKFPVNPGVNLRLLQLLIWRLLMSTDPGCLTEHTPTTTKLEANFILYLSSTQVP